MIRYLNSFRDWWANFPALLRFVVVVAVLLAGAVVLMVPVNQAYKGWRLERMRAGALQAYQAGEMEEARERSLAAIVGGAGEIEMFRILEISMGALSDHRHRGLARNVFEHAGASDEDRLRTFRLLSEVTPMGSLGGMWMRLPERLRVDERFVKVFTKAQLDEDLNNEAASVLLAIPENERTDPIWQGLIRVMIADESLLPEAHRWLAHHWPQQVTEDGGWFELLEGIPMRSLDAAALAPVRRKLRFSGMDETARGALAVARLDWAERVFQRDAVAQEVVARWKVEAPELLANWLRDAGKDEELLGAIPDEQVETHPALLPVLLTAARRSGQWERYARVLEQNAKRLKDWERVAYQAVMAMKRDGVDEESKEVRTVLEEAGASRDDEAFVQVSRIFRDAELLVAADEALLAALQWGRGRLPLYHQIRPVTESLLAQKRDDVVLGIYRNYLEFEPGEPELTARFLYFAMLRSVFAPDQAAERLQMMAEAYPEDVQIHHFLAAAHLSAADPAAAAAVLDACGPLAEDAPMRLQAIRLATEVANGKRAGDDPLVKEFPATELLLPEAKRFREWLALRQEN